jgi:Fic family protein
MVRTERVHEVMTTPYSPPYSRTPDMIRLVAEIGESIGRHAALAERTRTPLMRRGDRIRTIQASLEIENNTLSVEQVTAIIEGKRVLGPQREIREVQNAFAAYERLERWDPAVLADLLEAHRVLMEGLADDPGAFRRGGVGVARGKKLVHVAPPASRVAGLVVDLLGWLRATDEHPLIAGGAVHYEMEFIHPFSDGNGRMGRLWQTLILSRWQPLLAFVPVETVIRDRRKEYYLALVHADSRADATSFIEFTLRALRDAIEEIVATDQVSDQVSDQVRRMLELLAERELGSAELMRRLGLSHRPTFRKNYLAAALEPGWVERTEPGSPRSPTQRYRLTDAGRRAAARRVGKR